MMEEHGKDNIVALYRSGLSMMQVAAKMGISETAVWRVIRERGVKARSRNPVVPADVKAKVIAAYASGGASATVAKQYGVSGRMVARWAKRAGHTVHRKQPSRHVKLTPDVIAAIMAARGKETGTAVAKRLGLHHKTVYRLWSERAHRLGMGR